MSLYFSKLLKSVSNGDLDGPFCFEIKSCLYLQGGPSGFSDMSNSVEIDADATCSINNDFYEGDEIIYVSIDRLYIPYRSSPIRFDSRLSKERCFINGDESENSRILSVAFPDMAENGDGSHIMELRFENGKLLNIGFVINKLIGREYYTHNIDLYGSIYE